MMSKYMDDQTESTKIARNFVDHLKGEQYNEPIEGYQYYRKTIDHKNGYLKVCQGWLTRLWGVNDGHADGLNV